MSVTSLLVISPVWGSKGILFYSVLFNNVREEKEHSKKVRVKVIEKCTENIEFD